MGVKGTEAVLGKRNPGRSIVNTIGGKHLRAKRLAFLHGYGWLEFSI